ncbi:MAG TPA: BCAM0308 family protein [Burkholderiales bacterium]|nr:BCAM0308 family protein [Burkholderiales bacterium]
MKRSRGGFQLLRREQLLQEVVHDSYKLRRKLREPSRCRDCGAVYRDGRWAWSSGGGPAHKVRCPACQRIRDGYAAGYVRLGGGYFSEHRDEIVRRVRACERAEAREHPLERIIAVAPAPGGALVTTTGVHLAHRIAQALRHAFKGKLESRYNKADKVLRAYWSR